MCIIYDYIVTYLGYSTFLMNLKDYTKTFLWGYGFLKLRDI